MALSQRPHRIDVIDPGSGPIALDVHYTIASDNAEAVALGAGSKGIVVRMEVPRARAAAALGPLLADATIVDDGGWPEALIALPRPRK